MELEHSGFVAILGRPNVGKSTLVNQLVGSKVSIVSDKPNTTRRAIRGIYNAPGIQMVLVDTPGIHRPRSALGVRLNRQANLAADEVDLGVLVVEANSEVGPGDRFSARLLPSRSIGVVNKADLVSAARLERQLAELAELGIEETWAVSALTGTGVSELREAIAKRLPPGPAYFPLDADKEISLEDWVAELVREKLLSAVRDELPHSIATRVTEWEWPRVRVEVLVERPSQKAIVIGKRGQLLKEVGRAVREEVDPSMYLELFVKVERNWQRREAALDRLGY
jgi:GTP-binding protein Era